MIIALSVLLKMRKVSGKVVEKIETHALYPVSFYENCAFY
jgi:hypothetical protein